MEMLKHAARQKWFLRHLCVCGAILLLADSAAPLNAAAPATPDGVVLPGLNAAFVAAPARNATLLVIGFMGGHIHADNMVHQEAQIARNLQVRNDRDVEVLTFANHDGSLALQAAMRFVDRDGDGSLSDAERRAARVVIYGHSWGASETVTLARTLGRVGIPVLLTIQVDSVQKAGEDDRMIPSNVQRAINFYQREGLLNGRSLILAADPHRTVILGNQQLSYKKAPVNCDRFPWFARTFMKSHIEIENDPMLWNHVEAMIQAEIDREATTP